MLALAGWLTQHFQGQTVSFQWFSFPWLIRRWWYSALVCGQSGWVAEHRAVWQGSGPVYDLGRQFVCWLWQVG